MRDTGKMLWITLDSLNMGMGWWPMANTAPTSLPNLAETKPHGKVSLEFEAIMRWMVANPKGTIQEGARFFGVGAGWFSTVIHSDLFRARYHEFQKQLEASFELPTIGDRVKGLTAQALERLSTAIEHTGSEETLLRASKMLLDATKGPAQPIHVHGGQGPMQVNFQLDRRLDAIQAARTAHLARAQGDALPIQHVVDVAAPTLIEVLPPAPQVEIESGLPSLDNDLSLFDKVGS